MKLLCTLLLLLMATPICHAEIYKWVDASGRTHYSERKEDAGTAEAQSLKLKTQPQTTSQATTSWQVQERLLQQRQAQKKADELFKPQARKAPNKGNDNTWDEATDTGRCNLARDILSGGARHASGAPIDKHDRDIAENDVRLYCH